MDIVAEQAIELLHFGLVGQHVEVLVHDARVVADSPSVPGGATARVPCVRFRR